MKRSKIDYEISGPKSNMAYSKKKTIRQTDRKYFIFEKEVRTWRGVIDDSINWKQISRDTYHTRLNTILFSLVFSLLSIALIYFESSYFQYEDSNLTPNLSPKNLHIYFARKENIIGIVVILMMQVGPLT